MQESQVFETQSITATTNSKEFEIPKGSKGAKFFLRVNTATGTTPTLVVKIQEKDPISGQWVDVNGGAFASKNAANTDSLEIYPGVTAVANRRVSGVLSKTVRAVATVGGTTPNFNFSLAAVFLD